MAQGIRIDVDGTITPVEWENGQALDALQQSVGDGPIDVVRLDGVDMWIHDESMFLYPVNTFATVVATELRGEFWQNYHGPVVFTGGVDEDGNTLPLDAQLAARLREHVELLAAL